ncbi:DUF3135 domain-containing protein [Simiduia curdlanivorans]|uniref:DUF3135 domain-containing protein n=1 Tax=Simiduia curdlanivorans TaxID=1492769 RepID=A0ABV8V889_9GAMM|nr:DUF3135 domain-containing protein [Simiduia curdlanivorans]MDN3639764.1 DUF3135 domain-containing protein [Simiduia curdlanivorans]
MKLPNFDQLRTLAECEPEALESLRTELINAVIDQANGETKQRLRGLQFQIDAQRQLHKSPLGACIKISRMMTESFHQMIDRLNQPDTAKPAKNAKIYRLALMESEQ